MIPNRNIEKLDIIAKRTKESTVNNVSTTLALLQSSENKADIDILKQIGLDTHIKKAEAINNDIKRVEIIEQQLKRKVYEGSKIKLYCEKQGCQIVRVDRFEHEVPLIIGTKINEFIEENTFDHQASDIRTVRKTNLNIQASSFFLLTSIQSINGAPIKSATLFYRENDVNNANYNYVTNNDTLVEVASWDNQGSESSLLWLYINSDKNTESLGWTLLFFIIALLISIFTKTYSFLILLLGFIPIIIILSNSNNKLFSWNQK